MPDDNYYQERGEERNWPKVVLIILGAIILALIIFLLIKGCGKNTKVNNSNIEDQLLKAGKEYYSIDNSLLPQATGECKTVTLDTLIVDDYLNEEEFAECNKDKTYVKVCKLESGSYHYLPVMQCGSKLADDNFTNWQEGTEDDLVANKSDVRFTFLGEKLEVSEGALGSEETAWLDELTGVNYKTISSTKYYRYRDLTWKWQTSTKEYYGTNSYYTGSPASGYSNADASTTGWKWYTESTGNVWKKTSNPTITYAQKFENMCVNGNQVIMTKDDCSTKGSGWSYLTHTWTCDGNNALQRAYDGEDLSKRKCSVTCPSGQTLNNNKTECGNYTNETTRKYYPSGSTSASGENTYYVSAPVSGAIKDTGSQASVARYYKSNPTVSGYSSTAPSSDAVKVGDGVWGSWSSYQKAQPKAYANTRQIETRTQVKYQAINSNANLDNWTAISDGYLAENELISTFKNLEYEVESLEDIENASDLRYKVKLEYRNRK